MGFPAFYCCVLLPRPLLVLIHLADLLRQTFSSLRPPAPAASFPASSSPSTLLLLPPDNAQSPAAATSSALKRRLPILPFSSVRRRHDHDPHCAICLSTLEPSHPVRLLPFCSHSFHQNCMDTWLDQGHLTCPLCRSKLLL